MALLIRPVGSLGMSKSVSHKSIAWEAFSGHNGQTHESDGQIRKFVGLTTKSDGQIRKIDGRILKLDRQSGKTTYVYGPPHRFES
jgi:hypothetical protein